MWHGNVGGAASVNVPSTHSEFLRMIRVMRALIFVLLAWSMTARADVTPLIFAPNNPTETSYISISGQTRHCEIISIAPPAIERVANLIRVRASGVVAQNAAFCNFGIRNFLVNIGYFPQGQYRVELYIIDAGGFGTFLVRSDDLTVGPAPPMPVPSFSGVGAILMIVLLCGIGMWAARRR